MIELTLHCPICNGRAYNFFDHNDSFHDKVTIFKCINCGHGFYNKNYKSKQLNDIYQESYAENYLNKQLITNKLRHEQYLLDVDLLLAASKLSENSRIKVLDYGCSSGGYLDTMPAKWDKVGYEINPFHINYLNTKKKYIRVFNSLDLIDESFDLITMRGVIEHIPTHKIVIDFLNKHLKLGGGLFISATPDFSSTCASLYKEEWNQICCPTHIHQFSVASLSTLLLNAGLALRSLSHPYEDTPYANWPQDGQDFIDNFYNSDKYNISSLAKKHPFPGNMMSALYTKIG